MVEPVIEPMPPSTTIATTSKLRTKVKLCGARLPLERPAQRSRHPGEGSAEHERAYLVPGGVDPHRFGRHLILPDREEGASVGRVPQRLATDDGPDGHRPDPGEVRPVRDGREPDRAPKKGVFSMLTG